MDTKLNTNLPYGKVLGRLDGAPHVKFTQAGKFFDAAGNFVQYPPKPEVKEPEPEVVAEVKEPEPAPAPVKVAADKKEKVKTQLPPGLPTKE